MNKINGQVTSTMQPMQKYNYRMYIPMMCANPYMLWNQMMTEYNRRDVSDKGEYRPKPGGGHGPGGKPGAGGGHGSGPGGKPRSGGGHGHGGKPKHGGSHGHGGGHIGFHYDTQYDYDFNYIYYLNSLFYPYYPYNPYYDYYNDTY